MNILNLWVDVAGVKVNACIGVTFVEVETCSSSRHQWHVFVWQWQLATQLQPSFLGDDWTGASIPLPRLWRRSCQFSVISAICYVHTRSETKTKHNTQKLLNINCQYRSLLSKLKNAALLNDMLRVFHTVHSFQFVQFWALKVCTSTRYLNLSHLVTFQLTLSRAIPTRAIWQLFINVQKKFWHRQWTVTVTVFSYNRGTFRLLEDVLRYFLVGLCKNMTYFYFQCIWPKDFEYMSHIA